MTRTTIDGTLTSGEAFPLDCFANQIIELFPIQDLVLYQATRLYHLPINTFEPHQSWNVVNIPIGSKYIPGLFPSISQAQVSFMS